MDISAAGHDIRGLRRLLRLIEVNLLFQAYWFWCYGSLYPGARVEINVILGFLAALIMLPLAMGYAYDRIHARPLAFRAWLAAGFSLALAIGPILTYIATVRFLMHIIGFGPAH